MEETLLSGNQILMLLIVTIPSSLYFCYKFVVWLGSEEDDDAKK